MLIISVNHINGPVVVMQTYGERSEVLLNNVAEDSSLLWYDAMSLVAKFVGS